MGDLPRVRVWFYVVSDIAGTKRIPHSRHYTEEAAQKAASLLNRKFVNKSVPREARVMAGLSSGKLRDPDLDALELVATPAAS